MQGKQQKGKKRVVDSSSNAKKAVLLSGPPGIGKTTSARLICELLGFESFEVCNYTVVRNVYIMCKILCRMFRCI